MKWSESYQGRRSDATSCSGSVPFRILDGAGPGIRFLFDKRLFWHASVELQLRVLVVREALGLVTFWCEIQGGGTVAVDSECLTVSLASASELAECPGGLVSIGMKKALEGPGKPEANGNLRQHTGGGLFISGSGDGENASDPKVASSKTGITLPPGPYEPGPVTAECARAMGGRKMEKLVQGNAFPACDEFAVDQKTSRERFRSTLKPKTSLGL